jgi:hypothetical protein
MVIMPNSMATIKSISLPLSIVSPGGGGGGAGGGTICIKAIFYFPINFIIFLLLMLKKIEKGLTKLGGILKIIFRAKMFQ